MVREPIEKDGEGEERESIVLCYKRLKDGERKEVVEKLEHISTLIVNNMASIILVCEIFSTRCNITSVIACYLYIVRTLSVAVNNMNFDVS